MFRVTKDTLVEYCGQFEGIRTVQVQYYKSSISKCKPLVTDLCDVNCWRHISKLTSDRFLFPYRNMEMKIYSSWSALSNLRGK